MTHPTKDLIARLRAAHIYGSKTKAHAALFLDAAMTLARMLDEVGETADRNIAWRKQAEGDAARRGYEAGRLDGFAAGVSTALDPMEPNHIATVRAWHERYDPS
jgi:hypothetical protein